MNDGGEPSLLAAGREELTGGFHPLLLWRDRKRILAQPEIAAQPRPALANSPMRFALALSLTPLLVVGWLTSVAVATCCRASGPNAAASSTAAKP